VNSRAAVEAALRRLDPAPTPERALALRTTLGVLIPDAVRRVVAQAFEEGDHARLESLRRTFTVTAADGEADISGLLTAAKGLYPDALNMAEVRDADGNRFEWEPDRQAVTLMARQGFPTVAREGSTLIFSDTAGLTGTFAGDVTVEAFGVGYENGVVDLPEALEPALVDALVDLVQGARAEEEG
jgi:hypothetical protein